MKKNIKFILVLFISMIALNSKDVKAATTLPQTYNQSGYEYSIDDVRVECYKSSSATTVVAVGDKLKENKMDVADNNITINPTLQKGTVASNRDGISIKLNLSMKQSFADFVKNYLNSTKGTATYYVCFQKVDYKIKKVDGYKGAIDFKYLLVQNSSRTSEKITEKSGYFSKSQTIDVAVLKDSDRTVTTKYLSLDGKNVGGSDYMIMTDGEKEIVKKGLMVYVHDMANFNKFTSATTPSTPSTPQPSKPATSNKPAASTKPATSSKPTNTQTATNKNQQSTTVSIPDTAADMPMIGAIGAILLSIGSIVLLFQVKKRHS